ncbi:hypothetical protein Q8W71_26300 [Methylobacterium sp. NEAU 140]|nr:hypothetical protein [Methylobacterium sp. NEAU 140]MDP4026141.1 hypothetical protein [Methylobacterium sp. NEAU 140]
MQGWIINATRPTGLGGYFLAARLAIGSHLAPTMPERLVDR